MLDLILIVIFYLVTLPHRALREFMERNSGVGLSKSEQKSLRFWKLVALIGGGLVLILVLLSFFFDIL